MSDANSKVKIARKVTYLGKDPTLIRAFPNGPKIEVVKDQTVEVDETQANILAGIPSLWKVEGHPEKFDKHEESRLQEHQQDMKDHAAATAGTEGAQA